MVLLAVERFSRFLWIYCKIVRLKCKFWVFRWRKQSQTSEKSLTNSNSMEKTQKVAELFESFGDFNKLFVKLAKF